MSGKKKPRVARWSPTNPIAYAKIMAGPVDAQARATVNGKRHMALVRFAEGNVTSHDMTVFDYVVHIGRAMAEAKVGIELLQLTDRAADVIADVRRRMTLHELGELGAILPEEGEYSTLQHLVALVDMQMQSITFGQYEACQRSAVGALQRAGLFSPPGATT